MSSSKYALTDKVGFRLLVYCGITTDTAQNGRHLESMTVIDYVILHTFNKRRPWRHFTQKSAAIRWVHTKRPCGTYAAASDSSWSIVHSYLLSFQLLVVTETDYFSEVTSTALDVPRKAQVENGFEGASAGPLEHFPPKNCRSTGYLRSLENWNSQVRKDRLTHSLRSVHPSLWYTSYWCEISTQPTTYNVPRPWVEHYWRWFCDIFRDQRSTKPPISWSYFDPVEAEIGPVDVLRYPVKRHAPHTGKAAINHLTKCTYQVLHNGNNNCIQLR